MTDSKEHAQVIFMPEVLNSGDVYFSAENNFSASETEDSAVVYRQAFAGREGTTPQTEGLTQEELPAALESPNVLKFVAKTGSERIALPILTPVDEDVWYSEEFFSRRYQGKPVFHLVDIPGLQRGLGKAYEEPLQQALSLLAEQEGVIAFDHGEHPNDDTYERIQGLLVGAGISYQEDMLGKAGQPATQTYFGGASSLKREHTRRQTPLTLTEAFQDGVANGSYDPEAKEGAAIITEFSQDDVESLWQIYHPPFQKLTAAHPCTQGFSREEFGRILQDQRAIKVVYKEEGQIQSACILTNDMSLLPWVNQNYFRELYPEQYARGQLMYFPIMVTDAERRGDRDGRHLIDLMAELVERGDNPFAVGFDSCDQVATALPRLLESYINSAPQTHIQFEPVGKRVYRAFQLLPAAQSLAA